MTQKPSRRASSHSIPGSVGAGGRSNPSSTRAGVSDSRGASPGTGGGVRESATATPMVVAMTSTSTAATLRKRRRVGSAASPGRWRRRCQTPNAEIAAMSTSLSRTRRPYQLVASSLGEDSRIALFTMPLAATATAHHSARLLNRGTAIG